MRTMQSNTAWQSCVAPEVANNNKTSKTYGSEKKKTKKESTKDTETGCMKYFYSSAAIM